MTPVFREATESDLGYVIHSWTHDSYELERVALQVTKHGRPPAIALYKTLFNTVAKRLIKRSVVLVAVNPDDDDQLLGCLVYEPGDVPVIHYSGAKRDFSELGVARQLFVHAKIDFEKSAIHTGGMPAARARSAGPGAPVFHTQMPKAWSFVRYGLLP